MSIYDFIRSPNTTCNQVRDLVTTYPNLKNRLDKKGRYPIHIAVKANRLDMIDLLLPRNQDGSINHSVEDTKQFTPLAKAVKKGNIRCFEKLMVHYGFNGIFHSGRKSLLHLAISTNQLVMLKYLLTSHRPAVGMRLFDIRDNDGHNPISLAASKQSLRAIRLLLDQGDSINNISDQNFRFIYRQLITAFPLNPYLFPPKCLALRGGGAKGVIYYGVIQALEEEGLLDEVERIVGTSAGAITATLLCSGYKANEIKEIVKKPGTDFLDKWETSFICKNGLFSGSNFIKWMDELIEKKTGIPQCTFGEFANMIRPENAFKHLHVVALKRYDKEIEDFEKRRFCSEEDKWKDLIISEAVRASMSIPVIYTTHSVIFKEKQSDGSFIYRTENNLYRSKNYEELHSLYKDEETDYQDGGIVDNFPLEMFDREGYIQKNIPKERFNEHAINNSILGIDFFTDKEEKNNKRPARDTIVHSGLSYKKAQAMRSKINEKFEPDPREVKREKERVIRINDCGIHSFNFIFTSSVQGLGQKGIKTGYLTVKKYSNEKIEELASLQLAKKAVIQNHDFLLVKPSKNCPFSTNFYELSIDEQFDGLREHNEEFELLDLVCNNSDETDKINQLYNTHKNFFENYYVNQELCEYICKLDHNNPHQAALLQFFHHKGILNHVKFTDGGSLIHETLKNERYTSFNYLLVAGKDLKDRLTLDQKNNTVLHAIAEYGKIKPYEILSLYPDKLSPLVNELNSSNETPLLIAARENNIDIVDLLLDENNIDLTGPDSYGYSILYNLVTHQGSIDLSQKHVMVVEKFIHKAKSQGVLDKIIANENQNASFESIIFRTKHVGILTLLIENNINITAIKFTGYTYKTLLYKLVRRNDVDLVWLFCQKLKNYPTSVQSEILNYEIESKEADLRYFGLVKIRKTALIRAVQRDRHKILQILIDHGADVSSPVDGYKPIDYAGRFSKSRKYLKQALELENFVSLYVNSHR